MSYYSTGSGAKTWEHGSHENHVTRLGTIIGSCCPEIEVMGSLYIHVCIIFLMSDSSCVPTVDACLKLLIETYFDINHLKSKTNNLPQLEISWNNKSKGRKGKNNGICYPV